MRLRYLPCLGLALILNGLTLSICHPLGKGSVPRSGSNQDDVFLKTLGDYIASVEDLIDAKSMHQKDPIPSEGSEFYPHILPVQQQQQIQPQQRQQGQQQQQRIQPQQRQQQQQIQQSRQYEQPEQWNDYPIQNSNSGNGEILSEESQASQIVAPSANLRQVQDVVVFRLPEQGQQIPSSTNTKRGRKNRQKQRQNQQRATVSAQNQKEFVDYDPLGLDNLNEDVDAQRPQQQPHQHSQQQQQQRPREYLQQGTMETIVGNPQYFTGQSQKSQHPQEQLFAQSQTLPQLPYSQQGQQIQGTQERFRNSKLLIAQIPPVKVTPLPTPLIAAPGAEYILPDPVGTLENELEKPSLIGQLGSWIETGRKIMYLPRGFVDIVDQTMSYAEKNPYVSLVMDSVADKLFGSTKELKSV